MKETALETGATIAMLVCLAIILLTRLKGDSGNARGVGKRVIQYTALILIVPTSFILALEGILTGQETAVLFGTIAGYAISSLSKGD